MKLELVCSTAALSKPRLKRMYTRRRSIWLLVIVTCASVSCLDSDGSVPLERTQQADAARGNSRIEIIENASPAAAGNGRWASIASEPELEIGVVNGPSQYVLSQLDAVIEGPDGEIIVADASHEIRIFDSTGKYLRAFGGSGDGPGEFRGELSIRFVPPDTILTWDPKLFRLSWFTLDGEFLKDRAVGASLAGRLSRSALAASRWELLPDGTLVGHTEMSPDGPAREGLVPEPKMLNIVSSSSDVLRTIRDLPGHPSVHAGKAQVPAIFQPTIGFRNWTVRSLPPSIVVADDPEGRWALSIYDLEGQLKGSIRSDIPRRQITRELVEAAQTRLLAGIQWMSAEQRRDYRSAVTAIPAPDSTPATFSVLADSRDRLWVNRWHFPWQEEGTDVYDVIDRSGRWLGWVHVERSLGRILWIADDHILFEWTDALDVSRVRKHRLNRDFTTNG